MHDQSRFNGQQQGGVPKQCSTNGAADDFLAPLPPLIAPELVPFDKEQAALFLKALGKNGSSRLRAFPHSSTPADRKAAIGPRKFSYDPAEVVRTQSEGRGVYVVINEGGDRKHEITKLIAYFAEYDKGTYEEQVKNTLSKGMPEPTFVVWSGGKSAQLYWVLDEPITATAATKEQWSADQKRIAEHLGSDPSITDVNNVMRLPGAQYINGEQQVTGQAVMLRFTGQRYSREQILAAVPQLPQPVSTPSLLLQAAPAPPAVQMPQSDIERTRRRMLEQLQRVPPRIPSSTGRPDATRNTRDLYTKLLWATLDAFGEAEAVRIWSNHSPHWAAAESLTDKCRDADGTVKAASFFHITKTEWGITDPPKAAQAPDPFPLAPQPASQFAGFDDGLGVNLPKTFDQLWQDVEALADRLAASHHSYTRQIAQLRYETRTWNLSLGNRDLEQALDAAQRRRRPQSAPIPRGGTFRVKSKPWAVQGLFRSGVNLLVGQSGAGKSRLAAYTGAQWIHGSPSVLGFDIHGPTVDKRQLLILGTDQDRDDWHQTLAPYGLAATVETGDDWSVVKLNDRVEVLTLENGMRLGPDGLAFIRKRADEFGNGLMLIADSLAKLLPDGIDEDKSPAAGPVYDLVDALGDGWGILLHHTRKTAGKEQNLGVNAGRGSGAIDAAVSRIVGLGLIHHMEHGQMVAEESNPNRELLSTKRGGATLHVVVRMTETGWELIGDAGEQKRQQQIAQARQNLTTEQLRVLDACDSEPGSWLTIKQIAHALGLSTSDPRWSASKDAAGIRQRTSRLAELGLLHQQIVGRENQYRAIPEAATDGL